MPVKRSQNGILTPLGLHSLADKMYTNPPLSNQLVKVV